MKFPKSVFLIVSGEFFERFTYFTLQTTLPLYLVEILDYTQDTAMIVFHTFAMFVYLFPMIGAIIADSWLGKYRTILYLSIIYALGQFFILISSISWFRLPVREISLLGLFLEACGGGGIKPCVPAFGSDQFKLPEQKDRLPGFISLFFFMIYSSSVLATFISPVLRKDISCFGLNSCYPLAFLVPFIFIIFLVVIYVLGKPLYNIKKPEDNVIFEVCSCITYAVVHKLKSKEKRAHWLDHADSKCSRQLIEDTKATLGVFHLYVILSMYYAIYFQSYSRWTFQATHMNGEFFGYHIKPDQFHVVQSFLLLTFLPMSTYIIYPIIGKIFFINTPLRKITFGGVLAATAFLVSGILELSLEPSYTMQPLNGLAQIRVFNTINCPVNLTLDGQMQEVEALGLYQNLNIPAIENATVNFSVEVNCPNVIDSKFTGSIHVEEKKSLTYLLKNNSLQFGLVDKIEKSKTGDPAIRAAIFTDGIAPANVRLNIYGKNSYHLNVAEDKPFTEFIEVIPDSYNISIDGVQMESEVPLRVGGIYAIVGQVTRDRKVIKTVTIDQPYSTHMIWQIPQYSLIALAEVAVSVTALEFALSQAPASMKSVVVSISFLSSAIGNLIVIVIQNSHFFQRQLLEYFLFAGLMYAAMLIFAVMAMFYKYVDPQTRDETQLTIK